MKRMTFSKLAQRLHAAAVRKVREAVVPMDRRRASQERARKDEIAQEGLVRLRANPNSLAPLVARYLERHGNTIGLVEKPGGPAMVRASFKHGVSINVHLPKAGGEFKVVFSNPQSSWEHHLTLSPKYKLNAVPVEPLDPVSPKGNRLSSVEERPYARVSHFQEHVLGR